MIHAVLLPGFGGQADQPILKKLSALLAPLGVKCMRRAPPRMKLDPELGEYVGWLEKVVAKLDGPVVVVGRSFGGRLAVRLAAKRELAAVVLLGFPIGPPAKPRPLDEAALGACPCPTLVVQGDDDELGPLEVIERVAKSNPRVQVEVLEGAGHSFGRLEREALTRSVAWLQKTLLIQAAPHVDPDARVARRATRAGSRSSR
ncbi:MAG: alpha/beta family hydrolase [Myxococcaceae bacterium]